MNNRVTLHCPHCGGVNQYDIPEAAEEAQGVFCGCCSAAVATIGQIHALVAQQAIGLGATELRDDHVPIDGELGERPNV